MSSATLNLAHHIYRVYPCAATKQFLNACFDAELRYRLRQIDHLDVAAAIIQDAANDLAKTAKGILRESE